MVCDLIATEALAGIETSRSPEWLLSRYSPAAPGSPSYVIRPSPEFTSTDDPVTLRMLTLPLTEWTSRWLLRMSVKVTGPLRVFTWRWASTDTGHFDGCTRGFQDYIAMQPLRMKGSVERSQADGLIGGYQHCVIHQAASLAARRRPKLDAITMLLVEERNWI